MTTERDIKNQIAFAKEKGFELGEAKGRAEGEASGLARGQAEGRAEERERMVSALRAQGVSEEIIAKVL